MSKTISELKRSIANEVEAYVENTISEWYSFHTDVGEPKFTLGMTDALIDGLFIGHDVAQRTTTDDCHKNIVTAVTMRLWDRYVTLSPVEHDVAWNDLRDLIDGTYELLYGNTVADLM